MLNSKHSIYNQSDKITIAIRGNKFSSRTQYSKNDGRG